MRPREEHPRTRVCKPKTRNALQFPVLQMQGVPVSPNPAAAKSELTLMSSLHPSLYFARVQRAKIESQRARGMDELRVDR
jgi:hypothetical protein